MSDVDVFDGQWKCLVHMSNLLFESKIELGQLTNEIEEPDYELLADDLPCGFMIKGKRSPRKKKVVLIFPFLQSVVLDAPATNTDGLKLIGKVHLGRISTVDCSQEPISKKITMKETPSSKSLDKNPRKRPMNCKEKAGTPMKRAKKNSVATDPAPDLPDDFRNRILETGGDPKSVVLVIQKELTKTDMSKGHGRLSLPYRKIRSQFLKANEGDQLDRDKAGIKSTLIQPCLDECEINLRNWKSNSEYVLVRDWNKVCSRNGMKEWMKIQLWSFRRNSHLCFALVQLS